MKMTKELWEAIGFKRFIKLGTCPEFDVPGWELRAEVLGEEKSIIAFRDGVEIELQEVMPKTYKACLMAGRAMKMTKELWHELGFRECEKSHGTFVWEQYFGYGKYLEFDTERDWSFGQVIGKMFEETMDCVDDLSLNKVTRDWGED